ncbi:MAG: V-type ATP synthase subunit F [Spirochaetota bacterium]
MRYFAIGDEDTVLGFGLVGVPGRAVANADEAADAFRSVIGDGETGIVIITERIAETIRSLVDTYVFTEDFPLILEVPDRRGHDESRPSLREVVNQAIGISV